MRGFPLTCSVSFMLAFTAAQTMTHPVADPLGVLHLVFGSSFIPVRGCLKVRFNFETPS